MNARRRALAMLFVAGTTTVHAAAGTDSSANTAPVRGEIELGLGYLDSDAFHHGRYSGLTDQGLEWLGDFRLEQRPAWDEDALGYWRLQGERLGFDARRLEAEIGRQGRQRLRLTYQQTARNLFDDGRTPFRDAGSGVLILPADWTATGSSTADLPGLEQSLADFANRQRRRELSLDYRHHLGTAWRVDAELRRQLRDGRRELAGTIGTGGGNARAALLPVPVDYQTDSLDLTLARAGSHHQFGVAYHGSFFRNADRALHWQNPYAAQPQWQPGAGFPDGHGQLALPPDNRFQQLRAFGQFTTSPTTRVSLDLARGRIEQDRSFLPYSVDPTLAPLALPRGSLDGSVDTTLAHLRITTRPLPRLNLVGRIRHDERDNDTPRNLYLPVPGDAGVQVAALAGRINRPYSLTRRDIALDASYRLPKRTRLQLGYENRLRQRDYSEVNSTREHIYRGGVRTDRIRFLTLSADYSHERRDAGRYVGNRPLLATRVPGTVDAEDFENHPLLRKYYLADRDRDRLQLRADAYPLDAVHVGLAFAWNRDDYRDGLFGLNESRLHSWIVDTGYAPRDDVRLGAFYHHDRYRNDQHGRAFTGTPGSADDPDRDWFVDAEDRHVTFGANLDLTQIDSYLDWPARLGLRGTLDVGLEFTRSRSQGRIDVDSGPALATAPLPDLSTRLDRFRLEARYSLSEQNLLRIGWEHERYRSRDFALDGVAPDGVANVLLFGEASPRYRVNWITVSVLHTL